MHLQYPHLIILLWKVVKVTNITPKVFSRVNNLCKCAVVCVGSPMWGVYMCPGVRLRLVQGLGLGSDQTLMWGVFLGSPVRKNSLTSELQKYFFLYLQSRKNALGFSLGIWIQDFMLEHQVLSINIIPSPIPVFSETSYFA